MCNFMTFMRIRELGAAACESRVPSVRSAALCLCGLATHNPVALARCVHVCTTSHVLDSQCLHLLTSQLLTLIGYPMQRKRKTQLRSISPDIAVHTQSTLSYSAFPKPQYQTKIITNVSTNCTSFPRYSKHQDHVRLRPRVYSSHYVIKLPKQREKGLHPSSHSSATSPGSSPARRNGRKAQRGALLHREMDTDSGSCYSHLRYATHSTFLTSSLSPN